MSVLLHKLKEVLLSISPITAIVLILHFTATPIPHDSFIRFIIGVILILIGLTVFLFGIDLGITPLGNHIGETVSRSNKIWVMVLAGLILGFFISIAEPDLQILARRVSTVTGGSISNTSILIVVSAGIGVMLVVGFMRIVYNFPIHLVFVVFYGLIFIMAIFASPVFQAISFDSSGATTGALTVPFIMALAVGISTLKKDSVASESDSFGLVGVTSIGAIMGVLALGLITRPEGLTATLDDHIAESANLLYPFWHELSILWIESLIAILPLAVVFLAFQLKVFHLRGKQLRRMIKGLAYTYIGLVIFLTGVNAGFMDVGAILGAKVAQLDSSIYVVLIGFVIGFVTILAEPAVLVLTHQIEDVTSGYVKKRVVFGALTIGVGLAVALSMVRIIVPGIKLWHILLPGFIISIAMSFFVKKLFVGIAFDSGGVASGPMTATFILAFSQGVASVHSGSGVDALSNAFGMIALVAMTPIITLQVLGLIFQVKANKSKVISGGEADA